MGATGWNYFVPYESPVESALQRLRNRVFADCRYEVMPAVSKADYETALKGLGGSPDSVLKQFSARLADPKVPAESKGKIELLIKQLKNLQSTKPAQQKFDSIEELLEFQGENGTHSILDIVGISPTPRFGYISPMLEADVLNIFGSPQPNHKQIISRYENGELSDILEDRWQGIYLIAYRDSIASEIFFAGCSGD